jgi:putative Ig domain-containing protein
MSKNPSSLVFVTQSLTGLEVGEEYTVWLQVTGGIPSYSFAVTDGELPPGIEVTPLGTVNGIPSEAGSFKFSVQATDSAKNSGEQTFIVDVAPQPDPNGPKHWPLAWNNETSALSLEVGLPYEFNLQTVATGGTPPYKFDIKEGSLPDGLDMTPQGDLAGTPTKAGHTRVVIGLYDAAGGNVYQGFDCLVQE